MTTATDFQRIHEALKGGKGPVAAFGLPDAAKGHLTAALSLGHTVLLTAATDTGAARLHEDIRAYGVDAALFLPRETPLVHVQAASSERTAARVAALGRLAMGKHCVIVCSVAAAMQRLCPPEAFADAILTLRPGNEIRPLELMARLSDAGYERVEQVEGRGQAAMRGDILDVYPLTGENPLRIEFWGDEIDQMRYFDPVTQRSVAQCLEAVLPPALETPLSQERMLRALPHIQDIPGLEEQAEAFAVGRRFSGADVLIPLLYDQCATLMDYLPRDAIIAADEPHRLDEASRTAALQFADLVTGMLEREEGLPEQALLMIQAEAVMARLNTPRTISLYALNRSFPAFAPREMAAFNARPAPQYLSSTEELARDLNLWKKSREAVVVYAGERAKLLQEQLTEAGVETAAAETLAHAPVRGEILILARRLGHGFQYPELHLTVLTEAELFGHADRPVRTAKKRPRLAFSELAVGDYVVHEVHGIGRFVGVEQLTVENSTRDYLLIEYRGGDRLYIPTDQLDRVQKYIGGGEEDIVPPLSKLGGSDWQSRVNKARSSAKKLAVDLAALYAARAGVGGHAFGKDTPWQKQFEDRFPYDETPDQLTSIEDIKKDMESPKPMDRLLCGDVGYGKTEVALRAAFKAIQDGKQAAILVPTTILAEQHYHTATSRLGDFPVRVACLSRFRDAKEKANIKKALQQGTLDLVVGTHALLAKDIRFKDLGLLIVDEEQRFGVNHKEQIKELKQSVDVLTLTATPIPRTLNMSMTGIRDISVIETPPEERVPVQTFVLEYTDALLVDAVTREVARGGQVYIVYNRVMTIEPFAERLAQLLPETRILIGHGQMSEAALEKTMLAFMNHEADVLLCSTIIESGLDIPNVNTLVVIEADRMGLAQLYQLRGRVGRSTRLGYAYFTVRESRSLSEKAGKRLMAIKEFTQFGAGFQLAMRDLEIRGAGSLLGAEQHGHIADIGYEYYCKIMQQAVKEARGELAPPETDASVDIPIDAHIPRDYIRSEVQRLRVYRRIADIQDSDGVLDMREELTDRYGEPPEPVENLMLTALIKARCRLAMVESLTLRGTEAKLTFSNQARLDGGRLLYAVSNTQGARLMPTDPPAVLVRQENGSAVAMAQKLSKFVLTLSRCVDAPEGV